VSGPLSGLSCLEYLLCRLLYAMQGSTQAHRYNQSGQNGSSLSSSFTPSSLTDLLRDPQGDTHFAANPAGFHSRAPSRNSDVYLNGRLSSFHTQSDSSLPSPLWSPFNSSCPETYMQNPTSLFMRHPVSTRSRCLSRVIRRKCY
jgi:hypothetical protein